MSAEWIKKWAAKLIKLVVFIEFHRNSNFIYNDILPDFVARSKNYGNCSDGIVDSLMKQ